MGSERGLRCYFDLSHWVGAVGWGLGYYVVLLNAVVGYQQAAGLSHRLNWGLERRDRSAVWEVSGPKCGPKLVYPIFLVSWGC